MRRPLPLLSARGGAGKTFLAANLASLWKAPLVELRPAGESDLELHLGNSGSLARLDPGSPPDRLPPSLLEGEGWLLVDGLSLEQPGWEAWLEACGAALLVERGDLVGVRRLGGLLKRLEGANFPKNGLYLCWTPSHASQPLPQIDGIPSCALPEFPKAAERLAEGAAPSVSDPFSPFGKAIRLLDQALASLQPVSIRRSASQAAEAPSSDSQSLVMELMRLVREELNLTDADLRDLYGQDFRERWDGKVRELAGKRLAGPLGQGLVRESKAALIDELVAVLLGHGPLEAPLADDAVTEIMVNRRDQVYLERGGKLELSGVRFWDDAQLLRVIERIVAPLGRRIDESSPRVDARLADGSRVNAIIPPLALNGPCLTIRKFPKTRLRSADLVAKGSLSAEAAAFLREAVERRVNIVVSGGTGSGKTTLLGALSSYIPEGERIVTIEDSAELKLDQAHVVRLESRPKNLEGQGEVSIRDLVINSLRMRPDRIVVGECRGGEALDMLQAMNTGHDGSLTTVHANSPRDAIARLETLCLMSDVALPLPALRRQLASAVGLIVQIGRLRDGSRRVLAISEVTGMEGEQVLTQDIFEFRQEGEDAEGKIRGALRPTGVAAGFYRKAKEAGYAMDFAIFSGR